MKIPRLKGMFLYRQALFKMHYRLTEMETGILIGIHLMNTEGLRCSANTLAAYLAQVRRTPDRKKLRYLLRKLRSEEIIKIYGRGVGTNLRVSQAGKLYLLELESL